MVLIHRPALYQLEVCYTSLLIIAVKIQILWMILFKYKIGLEVIFLIKLLIYFTEWKRRKKWWGYNN